MANILSTYILAEQPKSSEPSTRSLKQGAVNNTATAGVFDLDIDANGRWSVEKFKGLLFQIERPTLTHKELVEERQHHPVFETDGRSFQPLTMGHILDYTPARTPT